MYPYQGWQPQPMMMGQQAPQQPVMFIPMPMGQNGKMPKPKSLAKQVKEWAEFQEAMEGKKKDKDKDHKKEDGVIKMSPVSFLMWLMALSIPVAAGQLMLYTTIWRSVKTALGG